MMDVADMFPHSECGYHHIDIDVFCGDEGGPFPQMAQVTLPPSSTRRSPEGRT